MSHIALCRAVARATGESLASIRDHGFSLADPLVVRHDPEPALSQRLARQKELDRDSARNGQNNRRFRYRR
jgi:hypothetical protein